VLLERPLPDIGNLGVIDLDFVVHLIGGERARRRRER